MRATVVERFSGFYDVEVTRKDSPSLVTSVSFLPTKDTVDNFVAGLGGKQVFTLFCEQDLLQEEIKAITQDVLCKEKRMIVQRFALNPDPIKNFCNIYHNYNYVVAL